MVVLEKYTGEKDYVFPDGRLADVNAVLAKYETALNYTWIVHTDDGGEILLYLYLLSNFRALYEIDPLLSDDDAIQAIQDKMNEPPEEVESDVYERVNRLERTMQIMIEETPILESIADANLKAEIIGIVKKQPTEIKI